MNDSYPNSRRFHRIDVDHTARLVGNARAIFVRVLDISLHGALVQPGIDSPVPPEGELIIELSPEVLIQMRVTAIHSHEGVVGLRCDELSLDSAAHLRRLVEFNLGDPALLERDFVALATPSKPPNG